MASWHEKRRASCHDDDARTGGRFIGTLAAQAASALIGVNWIRDLAYLAESPINNVINSNFFPLPQTDDQLRALFNNVIRENFVDLYFINNCTQTNTCILAITI